MIVRAACGTDERAILELINDRKLEGEAKCGIAQLRTTLAQPRFFGEHNWSSVVKHENVVAVQEDLLRAAGSVGQTSDGRWYMLWLHAYDDTAADTMVAHMDGYAKHHGGRLTRAFWFSTGLHPGFEAWPRRHGQLEDRALRRVGFDSKDEWFYMTTMQVPGLPAHAWHCEANGDELVVSLDVDGRPVGKAEVGFAGNGYAILWWIEIPASHRGLGMGRSLLRAARQACANREAVGMALFVDVDDMLEKDRRPAIDLYKSEGFALVDTLATYSRQ
jgi:ribosomal protein S18 acetylase RimI-like enzyme